MRIKDARQTSRIWLLGDRGAPGAGGEQRRDLLYVEDAAEAFLWGVTEEVVGLVSMWEATSPVV
jgi:nucleoside-diphosphate-sugar epimerase